MERLRGYDAAFLALETPTMPLHVAVLARLDPSTAPGGWSFERLLDHVASRLHLAPLFRRRVVTVPGGLAHPVWADDPDFDVANHVRRLAVAAPGGREELLSAVAAVVGRPLDRSRPLWELHVAEGIGGAGGPGGSVAVVATAHHAVTDGVTGAALLVSLLDLQPEAVVACSEAATWNPAPLPDPDRLAADAVGGPALVDRLGATATAARRTFETMVGLRRHHRAGSAVGSGAGVAAPFAAPRTPLNVAVSAGRRVALADLDLDRVKAVKDALGVTVNDVVLAVCSGALRSWLASQGVVPSSDLVALVPAAVATGSVGGAGLANNVAPMLVPLATTVDDPAARLAAVAAAARRAKDQLGVAGTGGLVELAEAVPPVLVAVASRLATLAGAAGLVPPTYNVSVSNVHGPPVPLYLAGARLVSLHPLGPITDGSALNITVLSYAGSMAFGLVADPAAVADLDDLAVGLTTALDELEDAVVAASSGPPPALRLLR